MAKESPWFKFFTGEWANGSITLESYAAQGVFINVCCFYWSKQGDVTKKQLEKNYSNLIKTFTILIQSKRFKLRELTAKLEAMSPAAILSRGYSITRTIPEARVIKNTESVSLDQDIEVMVAKGRLFCRVKGKSTDG